MEYKVVNREDKKVIEITETIERKSEIDLNEIEVQIKYLEERLAKLKEMKQALLNK